MTNVFGEFSLRCPLKHFSFKNLLTKSCKSIFYVSAVNCNCQFIFKGFNYRFSGFLFRRYFASFSHARPRGVSASMELLYEVTDALNLRCNFNSSHHSEYLLKMDSTTDFSRYLKASYLSEKGLHHQRLYSKT